MSDTPMIEVNELTERERIGYEYIDAVVAGSKSLIRDGKIKSVVIAQKPVTGEKFLVVKDSYDGKPSTLGWVDFDEDVFRDKILKDFGNFEANVVGGGGGKVQELLERVEEYKKNPGRSSVKIQWNASGDWLENEDPKNTPVIMSFSTDKNEYGWVDKWAIEEGVKKGVYPMEGGVKITPD